MVYGLTTHGSIKCVEFEVLLDRKPSETHQQGLILREIYLGYFDAPFLCFESGAIPPNYCSFL